ncbi:MAG TPA: shikimate kinase [Flavobacteriales bacterium]|nr:shikimate kinase [Flavobacteriales bacterium]HRE75854.1 shikimate kinase [Flavobacteriales bacterium]HRJ34767.1 shikimate kinase [Flavobacteriales bacterium]HRJ38749.1 shikimate kinase [Flavobacteriales bacterium]
MRLYLVGFMGSGKSTVAKLLAEDMNLTAFDLDQIIIEESGLPVSILFKQEGEQAFRIRESKLLDQWIKSNAHGVLATGGGTPCFLGNGRKMEMSGVMIYLKTSADTLSRRLNDQMESRPLLAGLKGKELFSYIEHTLAQRSEFYERARIIVNADQTTNDIVNEIKNKLKEVDL